MSREEEEGPMAEKRRWEPGDPGQAGRVHQNSWGQARLGVQLRAQHLRALWGKLRVWILMICTALRLVP